MTGYFSSMLKKNWDEMWVLLSTSSIEKNTMLEVTVYPGLTEAIWY